MDTVDPGVTDQSAPPADTPTTPSVTGPTDRPLQNVVGEFSRKFGTIQNQISQLTQAVSNLIASQPQAPPPPKEGLAGMTDDDLWERAKQGDKAAFDLHQQRQAERVYETRRRAESDNDLVDRQMSALLGKYRVLADVNHPLTQTANMAYALLVKRGQPANKQTLLDATKTAIADRPDLVAELLAQAPRAREGVRRQAAANSGVTGATYRQDDPSGTERVRVTPQENALARRMNVPDAAGAKKRFLERQDKGQSSFGLVGNSLNLEQEGF